MSLNVKSAVPISLFALGTQTVADDKMHVTVPFNCTIKSVVFYAGTTGTTSGNNDVTVTDDTTDIWTVSATVGRIAYNGTQYLQWDRDSNTNNDIAAGSVLSLNVDAVAGAGSPGDYVVTLWVVPTDN